MGRDRTVGAVILARTDSRRLPGKVLADVLGKPLLWYVVARVTHCIAGPIVLATSKRSVDDELTDMAQGLGIRVYRGDADNVAGRMLNAAREHGIKGVLRVNADSPFFDSDLIGHALSAFAECDVDFVTNLRPRSYPYGVSVELVDTDVFERFLLSGLSCYDREHVTACLYRSFDALKVSQIIHSTDPIDGPQTKVRLTIDEPVDLVALRAFAAARHNSWENVSYQEAVASGLFRTVASS